MIKFTAREMIFAGALFAIGWTIYKLGFVLNDFDVDIARLKAEVIELRNSHDGQCEPPRSLQLK
jgi:hypothetical protein